MPHFASLNGAAEYANTVSDADFDLNYQPNPNALARRSISIFSRRGTETPEPRPLPIAHAAAIPDVPQMPQKPQMPQMKRRMTERQRGWLSRTKSVCGGNRSSTSSSSPSSRKSKSTILHAVPPAKIYMTAMEEEMATSPNDEILSTLNQPSFATQAHPSTPRSNIEQITGLWSASGTPVAQRPQSVRRNSYDSRIGMWANGVAQWDDQLPVNGQHRQWVEDAISEDIGFTPLTSASQVSRPALSVSIPEQSAPRRALVSAAPSSGVMGRVDAAAPRITVTPEAREAYIVSPTESIQHTPPAEAYLALGQTGTPEELGNASLRPAVLREPASSDESSGTDHEEDNSSLCSKRSSATSVEAVEVPPIPLPKRSSKRLSGMALTGGPRPALPDDANARDYLVRDGGLPPSARPQPQYLAPAPLAAAATQDLRRHSSMCTSSAFATASGSRLSLRSRLSTRSLTRLEAADAKAIRAVLSENHQVRLNDLLESELSTPRDWSDETTPATVPANSGSLRRNNSVRSVMQPPERAPTLPRRSRKRDWRGKKKHAVLPVPDTVLSRHKSDGCVRDAGKTDGAVHRSLTVMHSQPFEQNIPAMPMLPSATTPSVPTATAPIEDNDTPTPLSLAAESIEEVLLQILSCLHSPEDLFATAQINRGMYRVFKQHEMDLIQATHYNESPAAWELRQWCPPDRSESETSSKASSQLEHTPQTYLSCRRRDEAVTAALKERLLAHHPSLLRPETSSASNPTTHQSDRYAAALNRLWTFTKIFGCGKGREEDITGQLDWLKGGLLANNSDVVATVNTNLEFEMGSVLLNPPDFFAEGNGEGEGLTAQQLFDLTELWGCLSSLLLRSYQGKVEEARGAGVFDSCPRLVRGDYEAEQGMLDEWLYFLLTLGLDAVLDLISADSTAAGFALAKVNGWTEWTPPAFNGSRADFLREPVGRVYEDRVAAQREAIEHPLHGGEQAGRRKEDSRKKMATMAAEIKLKRQSSCFRAAAGGGEVSVDWGRERRASSSWESSGRRASVVSAMSAWSGSSGTPLAAPTTAQSHSPSYFCHPDTRHAASSTSASFPRHSHSGARHVSLHRSSLQATLAGEAENTVDLAVRRIVEMGFGEREAKMALKVTDMGDGLRVDRAVEWLFGRG
ncbi:hypothetical protein LTR62_001748 [Meristemomyces frigidus]|uniref:UBA domain-containing protein n=1 Tax=Meristemomyces frigidus TaxID=1508187 RepID=A0AAN7TG07_9PEZI|nr:hypothetical protein LTR62_001748 [Meristemomyces frigidus]